MPDGHLVATEEVPNRTRTRLWHADTYVLRGARGMCVRRMSQREREDEQLHGACEDEMCVCVCGVVCVSVCWRPLENILYTRILQRALWQRGAARGHHACH